MLSRIRPRLSYANVVASIALFVVLGGGAYATIDRKIGTRDLKKGAVSTPKLKKKAVKAGKVAKDAVRTGKIRDGAVTGSKLGDESVTDSKIANEAVASSKIANEAVSTSKLAPSAVEHGKLADGAVSLAKLNSEVTDTFLPKSDVLYASVSGGALVPGNSRGATNAVQTGTGQYTVTFNRDITACAWFPSRSAIGTAIPAGPDALGVGGEAGQPNNVRVRIWDMNNAFANRSFSLLVVC